MTYSVKIAPAAERQLRKFDPQVRRRVQAAIDLLARDPRPPKAIDQLIVLILRLGHRREIYESR